MKITTLEELILKFNSELTKVPDSNKLIFIENEIKEIDSLLKSKRAIKNRMDPYGFSTPIPMRVFDIHINPNYIQAFAKAFNDYYYFEKVVDLETIKTPNTKDIIFQAYELVKYYKWLKKQITDSSVKPHQKKSTLTHSQKLLALYYLGIDMRKYQNNVKSAKILSSILDLDESNTKDYLTYFEGKNSKVKNKNNIIKMIELFEPQEFKDILKRIKEDS